MAVAFFFISHASEDQTAAEDLHAQLVGWGFTSAFLDVHPRDGLSVGVEWERELYAQVRTADAVIFLGSLASIRSRWCFAELTLARFCGRPILPLWLGGPGRDTLLASYQWLDVSADATAYEQLRHAIEERFGARAGFYWDRRRSPYPGLQPFQPEDAAMFFGRDQKISEVLRHLEASPVGGAVVAVIGPSGSGKSSLARAGVVPRLQRATDDWVVAPPFTPGVRPMAALSRALTAAMAFTGRDVDRRELTRRLELDPHELVECVDDMAAARGGAPRKVLLVVDQAEELISIAEPEQRQRFLAAVSAAARVSSALRLLTTLRTEVLGTTLYESALADLIDETVLLGPLDRSRIAEVIEAPARIAGFEFASGLAARMVDDTRGGDALPLLAYTLRQLTEDGATGDGVISHEEYEASGGVLGALARTGDTVARRLAAAGHSDAVRPTLLRLVTVDVEGEPARRPASRRDLNAAEVAVIDAFVQARLLTSDGQTIQIAHEALLRTWSPLRDAIAASREHLRIQSDLERLARDWDHAGRGDGYLLRDERLQAVRATVERVSTGERLGGLGGEYYDASIALEGRIIAAARRNRRRLWTAVASVIALLAGLLIFVNRQYNRATEQTDLADSRGLAAQANARADVRPDLAMLLAVEAWRTADTIDARSAALRMVNRTEGIDAELRSPNDGRITAIAVSPTQPLLAVGGDDGAIRLWDLSTRRPRGEPLVLPESKETGSTEPSSLVFSPDGSRIAAIYSVGAIAIWPLAVGGGPPLPILKPQLGQATRTGFSADGRLLAATGNNGTIALWDAKTGAPLGRLKAADTGETSFAFPDPDTLVSFTDPDEGKGTPTLTKWNLRQASPIPSPPLLIDKVTNSTFTPDGRTLVTWDSETLTTWDTTTGQRVAQGDRSEIYVNSELIVDPLGKRLAVIKNAAQIELFDLPSLQPSTVQPPGIYAASAAFSTDSRTLIIGGSGLTSLWSLDHPRQFSTSLGTTPLPPAVESSSGVPSMSDEISVAIEADGGHRHDTIARTSAEDPSRLISVGGGILRVWHLPDQRTVQEIPVDKHLDAVAVSASGNEVAMVNDDNKLQMWHFGDPVLSAGITLDGPTGLSPDTSGPSVVLAIQGTSSLALSADGTTLATGGGTNDGRIRLWDTRRGVQWGPDVRHGDVAVEALTFSPRGDLLASSGYGGAITLWHVVPAEDGTKRLEPLKSARELVGHTGPVSSIAFSSDGQRVLSGGNDGTVRLWDVTTGQAIGQPIVAAAKVEAVAFTDDGRTIAAGVDGGVQIWDAATDQPLGDDYGTGTDLRDVAFNADGRFLATIDESGEVVMWNSILWSADGAAVSKHLCAAASRNFTRGEWNQFLPQRPYESACPQWPPGG